MSPRTFVMSTYETRVTLEKPCKERQEILNCTATGQPSVEPYRGVFAPAWLGKLNPALSGSLPSVPQSWEP